ncbi:MAG TPA: Gfo/Idh/MocA family oxidoreductase [Gemmataceae bacterium]|nr:Gfo/Idh/MocA family oxidoreductase [Gemmataceae bacterium]
MSHRSRRTFLKQSALGLAAGIGALTGLGRAAVAANDKIGVACVGVRGQGGSLLHAFAAQKDVNILYICDIDESVRGKRGREIEQRTGTMPKLVKDYRTVLDDKSVDVLVIGTPDHWHALPTIHGCMAGKDVYVEKPDGHNIIEGQRMVQAARKYNRMVQLGTQARSAPDLFEAVKYVQSGALGKVIFGRAWETDRQSDIGRPPDSEPPPGVDYDMWLGPAPKRPFNIRRFHGSWRWFFDYGTGDLGNDGVHRMDYCRWVMGLNELPQAVSCAGGKFFFDDMQEWPDTMMVTYEYPGKVLVYEMRIWSRPRLFDLTEGAAVYGENGWLLISNDGWKAFDAKGKLVREMSGRNSLGLHIRNFLDAVRSRRRESLNQEIAQGHVSSVMCHAGNIAWRTGKKLRIDPKTETFDDAEANKYLGREYRKGYELPSV